MKVRASSAVILKTLLKMICMSADDGSRSTIVMGLPSGQIRVCALKIFTSSALVRLVVEFAVSATIASCFAWAVPDAAATHTNASSRRQSFIGVYSLSLEVTATDNFGTKAPDGLRFRDGESGFSSQQLCHPEHSTCWGGIRRECKRVCH